jgi:hypothetical protein
MPAITRPSLRDVILPIVFAAAALSALMATARATADAVSNIPEASSIEWLLRGILPAQPGRSPQPPALPPSAPNLVVPMPPLPAARLIPNWEVGRRADQLLPNYTEGMGKHVLIGEAAEGRPAAPVAPEARD